MANSDYYDIVNVGSSRLADDGECIRDAFVKINNNNQQIFNTVLNYDIDAQFGGWKLVVGVDNQIVVTNQISISNSVDVSVMQITEISNDININVENSLDIDIANNIDISINSGDITIISDVSNNIVLTANSFQFNGDMYVSSVTNTANTNNITFNANDIDITNTFGDINLNAVTNNINLTGDFVVNTNMFDINVTTGDINIQNGAITINNALDVDINNAITVDASQEVNINNALYVDASNNINIGINNTIAIDASQNITFAPSTNIDFTNVFSMDLDINFLNQVDVDFDTVVDTNVLIYNNVSGNFEAGTPAISLFQLTDVDNAPGGVNENDILMFTSGGFAINRDPHERNFAMEDDNIVPTETLTFNIGSVEKKWNNIYAQHVTADLNGSVFANDSTLLVNALDGEIPASVVKGTRTGDLIGSVFADDSTMLIDGVTGSLLYTAEVPANWSGVAPTTVKEALDRIAAALGPIA